MAAREHANCLDVLIRHGRAGFGEGGGGAHGAPWSLGLPDIDAFHPSRWDSCGGRACKPW